jgi:hypothetical protein
VDAYERKARLAPALLVGLPSAVLLLSSVEVDDLTDSSPLGLLAGAVGILTCGLVRDRGKQLERGLWASWGGPPAQRALSLVQNDGATGTLARRMELEQLLGWHLPTLETERADPNGAAAEFDRAIRTLIQIERRHANSLVAAENREYGFRRNMLGLRPVAILLALLNAAVAIGLLIVAARDTYTIALITSGLALFLWAFVVTPNWVRLAADRYAKQLLDSVPALLPAETGVPRGSGA